MKHLLWLKFYPKDWNGDHNLRACSLAARGLLASFLEPMHTAEPYGHLLVRGEKPDYDALAVIASCKVREVKYGIEELIKNGVLSANGDGILYSRRMVRDAERRQKQSAGGQKSMRLRQRPTEQNQQVTGTNSQVDLTSTSASSPRPIEARSQRPDKQTAKEQQSGAAHKGPSPAKEFLNWFQAEYKTRRKGAMYFVSWDRHMPIVGRLLKLHAPHRLRRHAQILLTTDEPWTETTDRGIEVLASRINWLEERLCAWEAQKRAREAV